MLLFAYFLWSDPQVPGTDTFVTVFLGWYMNITIWSFYDLKLNQLLCVCVCMCFSTAYLVGITGVLAPVLEENVFRGFLMVALTKWYSVYSGSTFFCLFFLSSSYNYQLWQHYNTLIYISLFTCMYVGLFINTM